MQALRLFSTKEPSTKTIPHTINCSFNIYTDKPATTPHYIKKPYKNKALNNLIAIAVRRQACHLCSSTQHWTNHCHLAHTDTPQLDTPTTLTTEDSPTLTTCLNSSTPVPENPSSKMNDTAMCLFHTSIKSGMSMFGVVAGAEFS